MRILVFANQKGGAGKTTLGGHIAVAAEHAGIGQVAVMDFDPQGSLARWWNVRTEGSIAYVRGDLANLRAQLNELERQGVALVVIDTPGAITAEIEVLLGEADLVVIPTRPSPHDLHALGPTVQAVERARGGKGGRPLFVINGAAPRARITAQAAVALSAHGAVCPVIVYQRTDFASSMTDGRTAQELDPESRSAAEISGLWRHISGLVEQKQ